MTTCVHLKLLRATLEADWGGLHVFCRPRSLSLFLVRNIAHHVPMSEVARSIPVIVWPSVEYHSALQCDTHLQPIRYQA